MAARYPEPRKKLLEAEDELTELVLLKVSQSVRIDTLALLATTLGISDTEFGNLEYSHRYEPGVLKMKVSRNVSLGLEKFLEFCHL